MGKLKLNILRRKQGRPHGQYLSSADFSVVDFRESRGEGRVQVREQREGQSVLQGMIPDTSHNSEH
jgi:hypothetical protein